MLKKAIQDLIYFWKTDHKKVFIHDLTQNRSYSFQDILKTCSFVQKRFPHILKENKPLVLLEIDHQVEDLLFILAFQLMGVCVFPLSKVTDQIYSDLNPFFDLIELIDLRKITLQLENEIISPDICNVKLNQELLILQTSGSTSTPKRYSFSTLAILFSALGSNQRLSLNSSSAYVLCLPSFHVAGLMILYRMLLSQGSVLLTSPSQPLKGLKFLPTHQNRFISLVATQLEKLQGQVQKLSGFTGILVGGGPLPEKLFIKCQKKNYPIFLSYGMTEALSTVTLNLSPSSHFDLGQVLPYRKILIGENQQIQVAGKTLFKTMLTPQYQKRTAFFTTSDQGSMINQSLIFKGRRDSIIISGGEKISPEEVSSALLKISMVKEAYVLGIPDPKWGNKVVALVSLKKNKSNILPSDLKQKLKNLLPPYHIPQQIIIHSSTIALEGKISKQELLKMIEAYLT